MLAELVRHVPDTVRTVRAPFEELPLGTTYDLVHAAAALYWTRAALLDEVVGDIRLHLARRV